MENPTHRRDRAAARVWQLTAWALAGAGVLTAGFAGIAAGSTHANKTVTTGGVKAATKTTKQHTVTAPTPTLESNGSTATPAQQQQQTQQQTQTPVTPATAPPVVVSGGS